MKLGVGKVKVRSTRFGQWYVDQVSRRTGIEVEILKILDRPDEMELERLRVIASYLKQGFDVDSVNTDLVLARRLFLGTGRRRAKTKKLVKSNMKPKEIVLNF